MKTKKILFFLFIPLFFCCKNNGNKDDLPHATDSIQTQWTGTTPFPFDMPSVETLRSSSKKTYAHFMSAPGFLLSIDNMEPVRDYFTTVYMSRTGQYAATGGYQRIRPLPRPPRPESNWRDIDLDEWVRSAIAIGLDGFAIDLLGTSSQNANVTRLLLQTAHRVDPGFKILLIPDMAVFGTSEDNLNTLAPFIKELANYPAALRTDDGKLIICPYAGNLIQPQGKTALQWWTEWINAMSADGIEIAFMPFLMGSAAHADRNTFKDISYGMALWGAHSPWEAENQLNLPSQMRQYTDLFMMGVLPYYYRTRTGHYDEAANSDLYRIAWRNAIEGGADWVQIITWNDYTESAMAPSTGQQYTFYDLTAYYNVWFKTGVQPTITKDALYYFYRRHDTRTVPSVQTPTILLTPENPPKNEIELLAFLTQPGTLEIQIGTTRERKDVPAGINSFKIPLRTGTPIFRLYRNGEKVITLPGVFEIVRSIRYQDLQYYGGSNTRVQEPHYELLYDMN